MCFYVHGTVLNLIEMLHSATVMQEGHEHFQHILCFFTCSDKNAHSVVSVRSELMACCSTKTYKIGSPRQRVKDAKKKCQHELN